MVTEALSIVMVSLGILATTLVILPAVWGKYKTLRGEVAVAAWRSGTKLALPAMSFIIFTIYAFLLPYSLKGIEDAQWLLSYFEILQRFIVVGFMLILLYILGRRLWSARRTRRKSNSLKKEGVLNPQLDSARKVLISTVSLGCCSLGCVDISHLPPVIPSEARNLKSVNGVCATILDSSLRCAPFRMTE